MKSILKVLVLGAIPILAVTMVADQTLAADKGSQLIFQANMAHTSFISVINANTDDEAVTVLTQYYNNEMEMVVWYLRVIPAGRSVLVNAFDHMIPGPDETNIGGAIMDSGKEGNGHFVIAVTAVGANVAANSDLTNDDADPTDNALPTVNVLFPDFLAEGMHKTGNIDECGRLWSIAATQTTDTPPADLQNPLAYTANPTDDDCADSDNSSKNVGGLTIDNAEPIAFNHLTGHFTEALVGTDAGGADQTASWGGTPIVRPAVDDQNNGMTNINDYQTLNGVNATAAAPPVGGRLAEKDAGGEQVNTVADAFTVGGYYNVGDNLQANTTAGDPPALSATEGKILNGDRDYRGLNNGALILPALHGGGAETKQIMLLLSAADDFGGAGKYKLMPAMTGYMVTPMDQMGNPLDMAAGADAPKFGGGAEDDSADAASAAIIVNGISVMTNADLGKCTGDAIGDRWTLSHLSDLIPAVNDGGKDFEGLTAQMIDPAVNAGPGWVKFARTALTCERDYGDGDSAIGSTVEEPDGVPTTDLRTHTAGTLVEEEKSATRAFVTTGQALLKYITSQSTFAASWSLKSPASPTDAVTFP